MVSASAGRDAALAQILNDAGAAEFIAGEPRGGEAFGELAVVEVAQFFETGQASSTSSARSARRRSFCAQFTGGLRAAAQDF